MQTETWPAFSLRASCLGVRSPPSAARVVLTTAFSPFSFLKTSRGSESPRHGPQGTGWRPTGRQREDTGPGLATSRAFEMTETSRARTCRVRRGQHPRRSLRLRGGSASPLPSPWTAQRTAVTFAMPSLPSTDMPAAYLKSRDLMFEMGSGPGKVDVSPLLTYLINWFVWPSPRSVLRSEAPTERSGCSLGTERMR